MILGKALIILPLTGLGYAVISGAQEPSGPESAQSLKACAAIDPASERLACYDQMAGRTARFSEPLMSQQAAQAPAAPVAAPTPATKQSFGLYSAEHPTLPRPAAMITARVAGIAMRRDGHATLTLDGGEVWEMNEADPLLTEGDRVTIARASLGSFILTTPTGRTHRVARVH